MPATAKTIVGLFSENFLLLVAKNILQNCKTIATPSLKLLVFGRLS